jgi:peptide/nickel transport system permease protein
VTKEEETSSSSPKATTVLVRILKSKPVYLVSFSFVLTYLVFSAIATLYPAIVPYNPNQVYLSESLLPPSFKYPFGTDDVGRNLFLEALHGAPIDALSSIAIVIVSVVIGALTGAVAGYFGGVVDEVIMRTTDVFLAFPGLVLAAAIAVALGPGLVNATIAIAAIWWPVYTRLARGEALSIREHQFVVAAEASGLSGTRIVTSHIIPNLLSPIVAYATADVGNVLILFSVIGYLGLGAQPPEFDLGRLVFDGQNFIQFAPWYSLIPGIVIFALVIAFAFVGDMMGEFMDPKNIR